jgi:hypothetical protein
MDYYFTAVDAGIDPFPIDTEKVEKCKTWVMRTAPTAAEQRAGSWRNGANALPDEHRQAIGAGAKLPSPPRLRKRSAAAGTFAVLEADLADACAAATRARKNDFDPHLPADPAYAAALARRILIVAATLWQRDLVTRQINLKELLSVERQTKFLEIVDESKEDNK